MEETKRANVYIDESGDLGYKRGSSWFCMAAVIIKEEDETEIVRKIRRIKERMDLAVIHFVKIKEFPRRSFIVNELAKERFAVLSVVADTDRLEIAKKSTLLAYDHISLLLMEEISRYLKNNGMIGKVMFSARGSKKDEELAGYLKGLLNSKNNQIDEKHIRTIAYKKASEWDMLQLADICASSLFKAHEADDYGFRYPCFIHRLDSHFRCDDKMAENHAIRYYPESEKISSLKNIPTPCDVKGIKKEFPEHVSHD